MSFFSWLTRKKYQRLQEPAPAQQLNELISIHLPDDLTYLHDQFTNTPDLIVSQFTIKQTGELAALVYLDGLTDKNAINNNVLRPLQFEAGSSSPGDRVFLTIGQIGPLYKWLQIESAILQGNSVLFVSGRQKPTP